LAQAVSTTRCFSVPDDIDDEDSVSQSEIECLMEVEASLPSASSQAGLLHSSGAINAVRSNPAIDLTGDVIELNSNGHIADSVSLSSTPVRNGVSSDVIDLTSEPERTITIEAKQSSHRSSSLFVDEVTETTVQCPDAAQEQAARDPYMLGLSTYTLDGDDSDDEDPRAEVMLGGSEDDLLSDDSEEDSIVSVVSDDSANDISSDVASEDHMSSSSGFGDEHDGADNLDDEDYSEFTAKQCYHEATFLLTCDV
jgi:hypothetical protein